MPILSTAVLLIALGTNPGTPKPLAGCQVMASEDLGWSYTCAGLTALIEDGGRVESAKYVEGLALGLGASLGHGQKLAKSRSILAGESVEMFTGSAAGNAASAWMAVLTRPQGKRLLTCASVGSSSEACEAVLKYLAGTPWRGSPVEGTVPKKTPPLTLVGKSVKPPEGCKGISLDGGRGGIDCGQPYGAVWIPVADKRMGQQVLDGYLANLTRLDKPGHDYRADETRCRLADFETACRRVRMKDGGRSFIALVGMAQLGEQVLTAFCLGPDGDPLPSPCSVVFQLPADPVAK